MLAGRERGVRTPGRLYLYSDMPERSFDFLVNRISAAVAAPCPCDVVIAARLPMGSGGGPVWR